MKKKIILGIAASAFILAAFLITPRSFDSIFPSEGCGLRVMRMSLDLSQPSDDTLYVQSPETTEKVIQLLRCHRYSRLWLSGKQPYNRGALIFMIFQTNEEQTGCQMIFDGDLIFCRSRNDEQYYRVSGGSELFAELDGVIEVGTRSFSKAAQRGEALTG